MLLAVGILAAVLSSRETGVGQVVDAAMVEGSALLTTMQHGMMADGSWMAERKANLFDGAAPFYSTYETADGKHVAVGALEPQFFAILLEELDLDPNALPNQLDRDGWPQLRKALGDRFRQRTREYWDRKFTGSDACVAPVVSLAEAPSHPHNIARKVFVEIDGVTQPGPAPRFSETHAPFPSSPVTPGADTDAIMDSLGFNSTQIGMLRASRTVA